MITISPEQENVEFRKCNRHRAKMRQNNTYNELYYRIKQSVNYCNMQVNTSAFLKFTMVTYSSRYYRQDKVNGSRPVRVSNLHLFQYSSETNLGILL